MGYAPVRSIVAWGSYPVTIRQQNDVVVGLDDNIILIINRHEWTKWGVFGRCERTTQSYNNEYVVSSVRVCVDFDRRSIADMLAIFCRIRAGRAFAIERAVRALVVGASLLSIRTRRIPRASALSSTESRVHAAHLQSRLEYRRRSVDRVGRRGVPCSALVFISLFYRAGSGNRAVDLAGNAKLRARDCWTRSINVATSTHGSMGNGD